MRTATVALLLMSLLAACAVEPESATPVGPDTVAAASVPALSPSVYQRLALDLSLRSVDSLLDVLLRRHIDVVDLWSPSTPTPCMAPCSTNNIIVALAAPDERIRQYGFDTSAGGWCMNCGVPFFIHYHVRH